MKKRVYDVLGLATLHSGEYATEKSSESISRLANEVRKHCCYEGQWNRSEGRNVMQIEQASMYCYIYPYRQINSPRDSVREDVKYSERETHRRHPPNRRLVYGRLLSSLFCPIVHTCKLIHRLLQPGFGY